MNNEELFTKGFNNGYLLSIHEPGLLEGLLKTKESSEYFKGLEQGKKQYDKEKLIAQIKKPMNKDKDRDR